MTKIMPTMVFFMTCLFLISCDLKTKSVDNCGDGFVDPGEACDGAELNGSNCAMLGYYNQTGSLTCTPSCRYDTSERWFRKTGQWVKLLGHMERVS